jgi:hypothetical protein
MALNLEGGLESEILKNYINIEKASMIYVKWLDL